MKRFLLWTAAVLVLAYGCLHAYSDAMMRVPGRIRAMAFAAPGPGDPIRGARLAAITGCTSCHGRDLGGQPFIAIDYVADLVAPDLTRARDRYDDAAFVRLFRTGAKADGRYALGMPNGMQQRMTDAEVADLIAYIRSVPQSAKPVLRSSRVYPLGRVGLLAGEYKAYEGDAPESAAVLGDRRETQRGRHLALVACTECHGADLGGGPDMGAPALVIAKAYTPAQFARLLRTGKTLAGTDSTTGLMSKVARRRFSVLRDDEIADLHAFLARQPKGD